MILVLIVSGYRKSPKNKNGEISPFPHGELYLAAPRWVLIEALKFVKSHLKIEKNIGRNITNFTIFRLGKRIAQD